MMWIFGCRLTLDGLLNISRAELTNGVGDGDVGAAAGGLLSGSDLEDTVDIDLEDTLEDGLTGSHWGDRSKGELSERCVVFTVDSLSLENWELNLFYCQLQISTLMRRSKTHGTLLIRNCGKGSKAYCQ